MKNLVASRAQSWLVANLPRFDPFSRVSQGSSPSEQAQTAIAELALLCYQLRRRKEFRADSRVEQCLDLIERVYRQPLFHEYPFSVDLRAFRGHVLIWLALADRNSEGIVPRHAFQSVIESEDLVSIEREPYRVLELRYYLEQGGFRHGLPAEAEIFRQTFLGGSFENATMQESDIYDITHTIPNLTDYGLQTSPLLGAGRKGRVLSFLRKLLGMRIEARDWDLVSELILSHRCLEQAEAPILTAGWLALQKSQNENGMIRHPSKVPPDLEKVPPGNARDDGIFLRNYHITMVAVFAGYLGR